MILLLSFHDLCMLLQILHVLCGSYIELNDVEDIVYSNGLFYVLDRKGWVFSCEVNSDNYNLETNSLSFTHNPMQEWDLGVVFGGISRGRYDTFDKNL